MLNKFDLEKAQKELTKKSYIYEGDNGITILKTGRNMYSLKKEDADSVKLIFEIEGLKYEIIPFKYQKYKKIFEKYENDGQLYFFTSYSYEYSTTVELFDFKTKKVTNKLWTEEIIKAAEMFKYIIHINEKPKEWTQYSLWG